MNRDNSIANLEIFLDQAVNNTNNDDELDISALDAFCHVLKKEPDLSATAARLLAGKIQSQNIKESLLALDALEECMDSLGPNFQTEVNKFKFLNELLRLVSKKYLGDTTPKEIQDRILDILFTWTDKYPELVKITEAYKMLRTQGVIHEPQKNVIKSNSKKSTDTTLKLMESEKFKRLLQSKNQKDIEAANLMIQNMVRDNDRKSQMQNRRLMDLQSANENSILLKEMLDEFDLSEASDDMLRTLEDIFNNCVKLKPTVMRLAEESHDSETFTNKISDTSGMMTKVIELYIERVVNKTPVAKKPQVTAKTNNLLDVSTSETKKSDENGTLNELNDIFSSTATSFPPKVSQQIETSLLTPQVIPNSSYSNNDIIAMINKHKTTSPDDLLGNFDMPSPQTPTKPLQKSLNDKSKGSLCEIESIVSGMKTKLLQTSESVETFPKSTSDSDDDVNNLIHEEIKPEKVEVKQEQPEQEIKIALRDINLDINNIEPSESEPRTICDEKKGLKILVNFTKDRPAKDVMVLVITVINQGPNAISNFQFDASVSKPCKLRILKASDDKLPGVKPFKPPTETINQIILLMNPTHQPVNMIAILTYNIQDDDDPVKESFEIKDIPFNC
ncbi:CLUMA_CG005915, isoform A [Clunio marinus]|uniref:CLUMA_CG005915, isoform A n=1 Tax=Clunio marinus TaxID=568069 RepID=A0A1J1HWA9_9DIPT|nr:CLUMA_CG005915, isoform A [Clunio marinus]